MIDFLHWIQDGKSLALIWDNFWCYSIFKKTHFSCLTLISLASSLVLLLSHFLLVLKHTSPGFQWRLKTDSSLRILQNSNTSYRLLRHLVLWPEQLPDSSSSSWMIIIIRLPGSQSISHSNKFPYIYIYTCQHLFMHMYIWHLYLKIDRLSVFVVTWINFW